MCAEVRNVRRCTVYTPHPVGSACAFLDTCRPACQTMRALSFKTDLTHFDKLHVLHAVDHVLRFFGEWVVRLILLQVSFQRVSILMSFNLMNQLVDYFSACIVFLFNNRVWQSLNSVINFGKRIALIQTATSGAGLSPVHI